MSGRMAPGKRFRKESMMIPIRNLGLGGLMILMSALAGCGEGGSEQAGSSESGRRALDEAQIQELVREVQSGDRVAAMAKLREGLDESNLAIFEAAVGRARENARAMKDDAMKMAMLRPGHPRNEEARRDAVQAERGVKDLEKILEERKGT